MTTLGFRPNLDGHVDASLDLLRHVYTRTERTLARWRERRDGIVTPAEARDDQARVRAAVVSGLGGMVTTDHPLHVRWLGQAVSAERYSVERLTYESLPGVIVPALLYRPVRAGAQPAPAVLFTCGHSVSAKADPEYQEVCARLASAGLVVLVIDPFGQGERFGYVTPGGSTTIAPGTTEHTYAGLQSWWLGESPARYFVHDARRGIDLLAGLPDVDPTRIGVTGNSGGGMLCTLLMAVEPRIAAAAPGTYVCGRGAYLWTGQRQDAEQILLGGTMNGVDHDDLLTVMAPRPVCVLAVEYDFFPYEATLETVERARRRYELLGAPHALQLATAADTHRYTTELAETAVAFFAAELGATPVPDDAPAATPAPPEALRCTSSGQVGQDDPTAPFITDLVRDSYRTDTAGSPSDTELLDWLGAQVTAHRALPPRPYTRWLPGPAGTLHGLWRCERDLWGAGVVVPGPGDRLHVAVLPDGTAELSDADPITALSATGTLAVVDLRAQGALRAHDRDGLPGTDHASVVYKLSCDLLWLGDSLAAGRTHDLLRAIEILRADTRLWPASTNAPEVHLHGYGIGAFHAVLAGLLDPSVATVTIDDRVVDIDRIMTQRLHDEGRGSWQAIIPGLARLATTTRLERMLGARLRRVTDDHAAGWPSSG